MEAEGKSIVNVSNKKANMGNKSRVILIPKTLKSGVVQKKTKNNPIEFISK